jgi:hypothetical protein
VIDSAIGTAKRVRRTSDVRRGSLGMFVVLRERKAGQRG